MRLPRRPAAAARPDSPWLPVLLRPLASGPILLRVKVILTGATGMVGEGVLLECLENSAIERVLSVSRRSCGREHPKLRELLVKDFRDVAAVEADLTGYDACFYCAGISSVRCVTSRVP